MNAAAKPLYSSIKRSKLRHRIPKKLPKLSSEGRIPNRASSLATKNIHATMTKFRPCIDLHAGHVKQIVGGTLTTTSSDLKTNFTSELPSSYYAKLYKDNGLEGSHVIMLGPGNEDACREACEAWPGHLQVGGGVTDKNAKEWIERGAGKVR